jgi:hypothetical protein
VIDEIALRKEMDLGAKADIELNHPATVAAFKAVEENYVKAWLNTSARDQEGRELAWMAISVLENVKSVLLQAIADGKVAQAQIEAADPLGR